MGVTFPFVLQPVRMPNNTEAEWPEVSLSVLLIWEQGARLDGRKMGMRKESWPPAAAVNQPRWAGVHDLFGFLLWLDYCRQKNRQIRVVKPVNDWRKYVLPFATTAPVIWMLLKCIYCTPPSSPNWGERRGHPWAGDKSAPPRDPCNTATPGAKTANRNSLISSSSLIHKPTFCHFHVAREDIEIK